MVHSFIHWGGAAANSQRQRPHSHIHTPMVASYAYQLIGGNVGFSVLPKDTSTCGQEEPGFEPPSQGSLDHLLYLLSHSLTGRWICLSVSLICVMGLNQRTTSEGGCPFDNLLKPPSSCPVEVCGLS